MGQPPRLGRPRFGQTLRLVPPKLGSRASRKVLEDAFDESAQNYSYLEETLTAHRAELKRLRNILAQRKPPDALVCSISHEIMADPHMAADGHTYEKEAIAAWFATGKRTSPRTGSELAHTHLMPNFAIRSMIEDFMEETRSLQAAIGDEEKM